VRQDRPVRPDRPSSSAEAVALARAHLHRAGVIDDPYARRFLGRRRRVLERALRVPPLIAYGRSATFAFLAARTRWFDEVVRTEIDAGIDQVVIVGAGHDARAWRLDRPGVRWFEADHPATQRVKRARAPDGGPTYVPLDLREEPVDARLVEAGLDPGRPSIFVLEGLTMYLTPATCDRLFAQLAAVAGGGSTLAVQFSAAGGGSVSPVSRAVATVIRTAWWCSGERTHRWADERLTEQMLAGAGWRVEETVRGDALARRHLAGAALDVAGVNDRVYCRLARRP
jgi:methyltransferase (TIGR00027 family)